MEQGRQASLLAHLRRRPGNPKVFRNPRQVQAPAGHHLGIYGDFLTYDFEFGAKGYQSKATYAAGIKYGYSHPIANRLNLDFALGIGYLHSNYKTYVPRDGCYVYQETKKRKWLGPTQAEISLVWLLGKGNTNSKGKGNTNKKKGGKK